MSFVDGHPTITQSNMVEAGKVRNISTLNDKKRLLSDLTRMTNSESLSNLNVEQHTQTSIVQSVVNRTTI